MLKIGQKIKYQGRDGTLTAFFEDTAYIKLKYARNEEMVAISDLEIVPIIEKEPSKPRKAYGDKPPVKITREQRGQILKNLVNEESIKLNFKREIMVLARLIRKFPHVEFLLDGFKPAIKANSLLYWINRPEVEQLYKTWAINLESKPVEIVLEKEKVGEDIAVAKKAKNLLDILD
jgi:hypothetical protein